MEIIKTTTQTENILETVSQFEKLLPEIKTVFELVSQLELGQFLLNHNFILRTGTAYTVYEDNKPVQKEAYRNYFYHAELGNKDIQTFYKEKDLKARQKAEQEALAELEKNNKKANKLVGKSNFNRTQLSPDKNPINRENHIYGAAALLRFLRAKQSECFVYLLPNSIDSGSNTEEVTKLGTLCRAIRIENDDLNPVEQKMDYLTLLGFPVPTYWLYSGGKSPHGVYIFKSPVSWKASAELNAQMLRHSGHDGYENNIENIIKNNKTLLLRLPGYKHQTKGNISTLLEVNQPYDFDQLESEFYTAFPKLGEYKLAKNKSFAPDTYLGGVQDFDLILDTPTWRDRFSEYESLADKKARLEKSEQEAIERIRATRKQAEEARKARFANKQGLTQEQIEQRLQGLNDKTISLKDVMYPSLVEEIENGTPDGSGRSHKRAAYIAQSILEFYFLVLNTNFKLIDTPEMLFLEWIEHTFLSTETDYIKKVKSTFDFYKKQTITPKTYQVEYFENYVLKLEEKTIGEDAISHLKTNKDIFDLSNEALRGFKSGNKKVSIDDLMILTDNKNNGWTNSLIVLKETKLVHMTSNYKTALRLINNGIPFVVYVSEKTSKLNLHLLAELCVENSYDICFEANASSQDKLLADNLRTGYYSQETRRLTLKDKPEAKIKEHKPTVVVLDKKAIRWGAGYFWQRETQAINPEFIGDRNDKDKLFWGYSNSERWFSDTLNGCMSVARNRRLLAFISEMGTGKTEALSNEVKSWGKKILSVSHREQLTVQAAVRLNVVNYKATHYGTSSDKYFAALEQGLAVTINTLVQGTDEQGYLPDFKIEDWGDAVLVIDEVESFIKYLIESGTVEQNRQKAIVALIKLIRTIYNGGGQIILADANMRASTINLFEKWCGGEKYKSDQTSASYNCYVVLNTYSKFAHENRKVTFCDNRDGFISQSISNVNAGEKLMFFSDVKNASERYIFSTQGLGNYLRQNRQGHILDADTRQFIDDPDHLLLDRLAETIKVCQKGLAIVVSPVIDSGTNWKDLGLDYVFACYTGQMGLDNTLQQLERVRDNIGRYIWAARRSTMGMSRADINKLYENFETIRESYKSLYSLYSNTSAEYQQLANEKIKELIAQMFPDFDPCLLDWWQQSLLECFYAAQEFRINLAARMQEKGYTVEYKDFDKDANTINELKEVGKFQRELRHTEIAESELSLLDKIEKNEDTCSKEVARARDLKSCLSALNIRYGQKDHFGWVSFDEDERLELVKRTLGKKSRTRRKLIYGFSFRCSMTNDIEQEKIASIIMTSDDFKNMTSSMSRSIKDIPISFKAGYDFMLNQLQIKKLASVLLQEATKRGLFDGGKPILYFHNRLPIIKEVHEAMVNNRTLVKKIFGFDVDCRPQMAARNLATFFKTIGFICEKGKNREEDAGKSQHGGNQSVSNYTIKEDKLNFKIWKGWVAQYEGKDQGFFQYFYNPAGIEGGDELWKAKLGIAEKCQEIVISKQQYSQKHRQTVMA